MNIPDNLSQSSNLRCYGRSNGARVGNGAKKIKKELSAKKIPLLGITAAFSFLIMMFNVPVPCGTTAHAICATLIAILIGPFSACISVTIAFLVQALFFGDGGCPRIRGELF